MHQASILITGATNGLGLALAEELAEAVHQLLLHGRAPQRPVPIAQRFGAEQYIADLSALAETQRNHLSPVLLTRQLLPLLRGQPITQRQHRLGRAGTGGITTTRSISIWSGP
ncbi:hypothetical protein AB0A94_33990 [Streptomyces sp. NPDC044984]|uniref:hypothetical protein n=1 Tax=Streptomyces sp. NPDC044984 TaxID=3154335 RepID=UPI0033C89B66